MAAFEQGKVVEIAGQRAGIVWTRVALGGREVEAAGWPAMLGPVRPGDRVVVNVTGIDLGLGTGGSAFILWNLDGPGPPGPGTGHIVKLRYTPWQTEVDAVEAPESPHHDALATVESIDGMPVVACGLHSQVASAAAGIAAARPGARIGYLMTDAGALPIAFSRLVDALVSAGIVHVTATSGHAFGGDLEAVNVYSGLAALRHVGGCDAAVVGLGPGVVGTGTRLGFSAIEQGQVLDAAGALGGRAIAAVRITFSEERGRHRGISHHTVTALRIAARDRAVVAVPMLAEADLAVVTGRLRDSGVAARHDVEIADGAPGVELLERHGLRVSSMGRPFEEVRDLHLAAAAAGALAGIRA